MAWPNPALLDDFNRPDELPLTGDGITTGWTGYPSYNRTPNLVNMHVETNTASDSLDARWTLFQVAANSAASQRIVDWERIGGQGGEWRLHLAISGPGLGFAYSLEYGIWHDAVPVYAHLRRHGSWFHDCSIGLLPPFTQEGDEVGLYVNDRSIEFWYHEVAQPWLLIDSVDDAALSGLPALGIGYPGFGISLIPGATTFTESDDFHAGPPAASLPTLEFSFRAEQSTVAPAGIEPGGPPRLSGIDFRTASDREPASPANTLDAPRLSKVDFRAGRP